MVSSIVDKLKCFNDQNFKFDPKYHKYTYGGKQYTSVTKFISNFHKPFEQDYWSQKKADEAGVPQEWILKEWKDKNDRANFVGHSTHEWIENYFIQSTAYALMCKERYDLDIEQIVILIAVDGDLPQVFVKDPNDYVKRTIEVFDTY